MCVYVCCCIMSPQNATFGGVGTRGGLRGGPMTSIFELGWDFCTMFNRSEVIVLTNKQIHNRTPLKTPTLLCYTTPVDKNNIYVNKCILVNLIIVLWSMNESYILMLIFIIHGILLPQTSIVFTGNVCSRYRNIIGMCSETNPPQSNLRRVRRFSADKITSPFFVT